VRVKKAVITAAGQRQRHLPLQTIVDGEGRNRRVLGLLIDEVASAGIDEVGVVIRPGTEDLYRDAIDDAHANVRFIEQAEPKGYGHAVLCASQFTGTDPFVLMVSDHIYVSDSSTSTCAQQLVQAAEKEGCVVSAVQPTHESRLSYFGAVGGTIFDNDRDLYTVTKVLEKPTPTDAEQQIMTPGIRNGHYLCFLGMHVLQPIVLEVLERRFYELPDGQMLELSSALDEISEAGRYLAQVIQGRRYDLDRRHGLLVGQLAVSLAGSYRDDVLTSIIDLLAHGKKG
jgi:UTP--glucose-1-phosphate uridylyltransferase